MKEITFILENGEALFLFFMGICGCFLVFLLAFVSLLFVTSESMNILKDIFRKFRGEI